MGSGVLDIGAQGNRVKIERARRQAFYSRVETFRAAHRLSEQRFWLPTLECGVVVWEVESSRQAHKETD